MLNPHDQHAGILGPVSEREGVPWVVLDAGVP